MPEAAHPTLRVLRLGMQLRRLREEAGLTLVEASTQMERSLSSLSKIETGRNLPRARDLRAILDSYGLKDDHLRELLLTLLRDARKRGWWQEYGDVLGAAAQDFLSLEADAGSIRTFETILIPGLLQTGDYAREVIQAPPTTPADTVGELVAIRTARQAALHGSPPLQLWAIIGEAALHQQVGGVEVMRAQLAHLIEMSRLDNVKIQVLPFSVGAHAGIDGPFLILELPEYDDWNIAYAGNLAGSLYLEHQEDIRRFAMVFTDLGASALSEAGSRTLIERLGHAL